MSENEYACMRLVCHVTAWDIAPRSQQATNALLTPRREDSAQPDTCPSHRQPSTTTAVTRDISFDRNSCLPARPWISLIH